MTCAEAARLYVLTLLPVTALVGQRVWTFKIRQSPDLPFVYIKQIGDIQFGHLRGTAQLKWARVQVDCIADDIREAREVDQAVMGGYAAGVALGLLGATATVGGSPSVGMTVGPESLFYREEWEPAELKQARTSRDYKVWITSV